MFSQLEEVGRMCDRQQAMEHGILQDFAEDIPLPGEILPPPLPIMVQFNTPVASVDPSTPTQAVQSQTQPPSPMDSKPVELPKPSQKGIEQAKKMLRAFSIQRKQAIAPVKINPPVITKQPATEYPKEKPKFERPKKVQPTHPSLRPLSPTSLGLGLTEGARRRLEIAELGIPLSIIPAGDPAMPDKPMPIKGMPPSQMLTSEQLDELIIKGRKAKEKGEVFKVNFKQLFPTYENPFQQYRKKIFPLAAASDKRDKIHNEVKRQEIAGKKEQWSDSTRSHKSDRGQGKTTRDADRNKYRFKVKQNDIKREKGVSKDDKGEIEKHTGMRSSKDKDVNLKDFVVCDSWSLEGDDRADESQDSAISIIKEISTTKTDDILVEMPNISKDRDIFEEPLVKTTEEKNTTGDKASKEKVKLVENKSSGHLIEDSQNSVQCTAKTNNLRDLKENVVTEEIENLYGGIDVAISKSFEPIDEIPLAKQNSGKDISMTKGKDEKNKSKNTPTTQSKSSRASTPDIPKDSVKCLENNDNTQQYDSEIPKLTNKEPSTPEFDYMDNIISSPKLEKYSKEMSDSLDSWNFILKICQPLLFRHDRNKCYKETKVTPPLWFAQNPRFCSCVKDRSIVYEELNLAKMSLVDRVYGCDQIVDDKPHSQRNWYIKNGVTESPILSREIPVFPTETSILSKETNNLITETENTVKRTAGIPDSTTVIRSEQKQGLSSQKGIVETMKSAVDVQKPEQQNLEIDISKSAHVPLKPVPPPETHFDPNLDEEYEKFMQAVWKEKADLSKKEEKYRKNDRTEKKSMRHEISDSNAERKRESLNKKRDNTSELGTSMDESSYSVEEFKEKKNKIQFKKEKKKTTSEYWSHDSDEDEKSDGKKSEKPIKKITKKKKKHISSSDSESGDDFSSKASEKKSKKNKRKLSKSAKEKRLRRKRLEKKQRLKKLKEKRMKKLKKLKATLERSLEVDEDVGDIIKKEKQKKKDEVKVKDKKKLKKKKVESKKKKKKVSSSSSMSSTSSSESEPELKTKKKRRSKKEDKQKSKKKKEKASESYSEQEEEFDMNILNNIKMEQLSDEEKYIKEGGNDTSSPVEEFSPRRKEKPEMALEIVSMSELQSDFSKIIKLEKFDEVTKEAKNRAEDVLSSVDSGEYSPALPESPVAETETLTESPDAQKVPEPKEIESKKDNTSLSDSSEAPTHVDETTTLPSTKSEQTIPEHEVGEIIETKVEDHTHGCESSGYFLPAEYFANMEIMVPEKPVYTEEPRAIETVISRGEIKCDWRPSGDVVKPASGRMSRWGMQCKPGEDNVGPTSSPEVFQIESVMTMSQANQRQYRIETIANVSAVSEETDYDGAYADMYGESDRLQYGDCFSDVKPMPTLTEPPRLSLDDRIGLVLQQEAAMAAQVAKEESPEMDDNGILINRMSPGGREYRRGVKRRRAAGKRVSYADGYKPGQDSENEEPPTKKKSRRRYGCAWPCPADHPDHVPLWDALPPPPPPPGSPPPPPAPPPPPPHLLRAGKRQREAIQIPELLVPPEEPMPKITRLPKMLSQPPI